MDLPMNRLPFMTCDNNGTSSCFFIFIDMINLIKPLTGVSGFELFCEIIIADAASVDDRTRRKDVLNENESESEVYFWIWSIKKSTNIPQLLGQRSERHHQQRK